MRTRRLLCVACLGGLLPVLCVPPASAATFTAACSGTTGDPASLVAAIDQANAASGPDTVALGARCVYMLTAVNNYWYGPNGLPPIASDVTIDGHGATITRSSFSPNMRFFFVGADPASVNTGSYISPGPGKLTLRDVTLTAGWAKGGDSDLGGAGGGMGGAIFNQGTVVIDASTLTGNLAQGGSADIASVGNGGGGIGTASSGTAGGGAGLSVTPPTGGTGGSFTPTVGGGGGGGGGFSATEDGFPASASSGGAGGGIQTGLGGYGAGGRAAGDGSGGGGDGGTAQNVGEAGGAGGGFGAGGAGGADVGGAGGGGGGVGGGGGASPNTNGGGGGFGGGGGYGYAAGGGGGFGAGGASSATVGGAPGFGGGTPTVFPKQGGGGAGMGGAIFNMQGTLTITNSTIASNMAIGGGPTNISDPGKGIAGAVFNLSGTFTATSSTFAGNTAAYYASQIYNLVYDGHTARTAQTTLRDTIVSGGSGATFDLASNKTDNITPANLGSADADVSQSDLVRTMNAQEHGTITGTPVTTDPLLGPLQFNGGPGMATMALSPGSPALKIGSGCPAVDERGASRPAGLCDLGAFQATVAPHETPTLSGLRVSPKRFSLSGRKAGGRCVKPTANNKHHPKCRRPIKLKVSYMLTTAATVTFKVTAKVPGRKVKGRCVKQTKKNHRDPACSRRVTLGGSIVQMGTVGTNSFIFNGAIGGRKLGPGNYTLTATPAGGKAATVAFKIER